MIPFNPWSTVVVIVCAVPETDWISCIFNPNFKSSKLFSKVSLVMLLFGSFIETCPIGSGSGTESAASGFEFGLSLFNWGYKFWIGWEKLSSVNGVTDGLFDEFVIVKWYIPSWTSFSYGWISSDLKIWYVVLNFLFTYLGKFVTVLKLVLLLNSPGFDVSI